VWALVEDRQGLRTKNRRGGEGDKHTRCVKGMPGTLARASPGRLQTIPASGGHDPRPMLGCQQSPLSSGLRKKRQTIVGTTAESELGQECVRGGCPSGQAVIEGGFLAWKSDWEAPFGAEKSPSEAPKGKKGGERSRVRWEGHYRGGTTGEEKR